MSNFAAHMQQKCATDTKAQLKGLMKTTKSAIQRAANDAQVQMQQQVEQNREAAKVRAQTSFVLSTCAY
eukprot:8057706-Pyramimonas_sp.AAC.1